MNTENAILGQYGLLFIFLSNAEWEALPHNLLHASSCSPWRSRCSRGYSSRLSRTIRFSNSSPASPNNAANAVLKDVEMQTNNKATVYKAYLLMHARMINSFSQADITALSKYPYGVGNRSALDLYNHAVIQHSTLSQADFNTITAKRPCYAHQPSCAQRYYHPWNNALRFRRHFCPSTCPRCSRHRGVAG